MFAAKNELFTRPSGGFVIPRSLRFRASASAYLNRTFGTPTDAKTQTLSLWIKRGLLGNGAAEYYLLTSGSGGTECRLVFNTDDTFTVFLNNVTYRTTTQVFRDPSAWYHLVFVLDTANATANSRFLMYVNGVVVSSFSVNSAITQNATFSMFSAVAHNLCRRIATSADYLDGYLAEVNLVDGQALTPTSFGATNTITGVWSPINYGGTYGNNGFHLDFNSYATQAALGTDTSGNSNTWTVNGCSVTAGVTYDSMIDVPTVTDTGSNYAVLNPLNPTGCTVTAGNLTSAGTVVAGSRSSMTMSAGKWYWEVTVTVAGGGGGSADLIGLVPVTTPYDTDFSVVGSFGIGYYANSAQSLFINGVYTAYGASYYANDVIGIKIDVTNNTVEFLLNNTSQGVINTTLLGKDWVAVHGNRSPQANTKDFNFGQRPFAYTAPTGFNSLNTYNLAAPSILKGNEYMDATTYTGTGASLGVTNAGGFQPDFVWAKSRSAATDHKLTNSVRGATKAVTTNTLADETTDTQGLTAFNTGGFTVGTNTDYNNSAATYVGWQWKGGGAAVTNTSGTITSSVSASTISGFSVATYTGNGGATATVGHGLGAAPQFFFILGLTGNVSQNHRAYHAYQNATPQGGNLLINSTAAYSPDTGEWNNTAPSSTVISFGSTTAGKNNSGATYVIFSWTPITGYSAFGSYTGNGSADGPFIYCGFRPRWLMLKRSSTASVTYGWQLYDTSRSPYNTSSLPGFWADTLSAELANIYSIDLLSNGFKLKDNSVNMNANGDTYIYAAFAENPFNNSLAR